MTADLHPLPVTFRQREIRAVVEAVRAGESCALVGVGSSGKSNCLRFLAEPRVQRHYLAADRSKRVFVLVDGHLLASHSEASVYRLLLDSLFDALNKHTGDRLDPAQWLAYSQTMGRLMEMEAAGHGSELRHFFKRVVADLQTRRLHMVFLLDEFDEALRQCDSSVFAGLRALRDQHKYSLVYVLAVENEMAPLPSLAPPFQAFARLFAEHTVYLGPHTAEEAWLMLNRLAARNPGAVRQEVFESLVVATGGHAGMLHAAFWAMRAATETRLSYVLRRLSQAQSVQAECHKIMRGLEQSEVEQCELILLGAPEQGRALRRLLAKGIVREPSPYTYRLFSPLFRDHILSHSTRYRGRR